jgi:hypothetical protein
VNATDLTVTLNNVSVTQNSVTAGKGGGGYIMNGTLAGALTALTGNTDTGGIPGIGVKSTARTTITVPPNQQTLGDDL